MVRRNRTYSELRRIDTFEERFKYLSLLGEVGAQTFGGDRYINQNFYASREWKLVRRDVIARDLGCDLGIEGQDILDKIYIHHMNPMNVENILHDDESILDPEFLICTSHQTHNAIHYGVETQLPRRLTQRRPGDTALWARRS